MADLFEKPSCASRILWNWPEEIMQKPAIDIDVLIVGAGPVGLFLANECARRSLRWRLVEARPSQSVYSKALAIFPWTLEYRTA